MLCSVAGVTVNGVVDEMELSVAVKVEEPMAIALTRPLPFTVATDAALDDHCTWVVIFAVLPLE